MAIDDVISDYDNQITNGARLAIQPASGDEWLVTLAFCEGTGWNINPNSDTANNRAGIYGGATAATDDLSLSTGINKFKLLVTNSAYVRWLNSVGSTRNGGFSAIKTKD